MSTKVRFHLIQILGVAFKLQLKVQNLEKKLVKTQVLKQKITREEGDIVWKTHQPIDISIIVNF